MKNNDEPAFPRDHRYDGHNGMSLRDYIAIKAMQSMIGKDLDLHFAGKSNAEMLAAISSGAYKYADAMLAERDK